MAVMLGSGIKDKDVLKLAKEIVALFEKEFETLNVEKLSALHGLGPARAAQILAAVELSRRYLIKQNVKITCAEDVWRELTMYAERKQEHVLSLTLDGTGHLIEKRVVFVGTLNQSLVHPREIFADAITDRAAGIIVAHNHPGGQLVPSREDISITERLKEVGKIVASN